MKLPLYFNPKNSLNLFGLADDFNLFKKLYLENKLPNTSMLSGKKGSGKSTLINHLMFYIFDKINYDDKIFELETKSIFYNQFSNDMFPNIIYVNGSDYKTTKIDEIRNLKKMIHQTSISNKPRFIIFNDVELFNNNSLNALLKIVEEPTNENFFILINNNSKPLLQTIQSRCLNFKIILNEDKRQNIIESLIKRFNIDILIDPVKSQLTPGLFLKFNYIFDVNKILLDDDFQKNLENLLKLYKKDKDIIFFDMILFLINYYFNNLKNTNLLTREKIIACKSFVFENVNKFFLYNLNHNALLTSINNKLNEK